MKEITLGVPNNRQVLLIFNNFQTFWYIPALLAESYVPGYQKYDIQQN